MGLVDAIWALEMQRELEALESSEALDEPARLGEREEIIYRLAFLEDALNASRHGPSTGELQARIDHLRARAEAADSRLVASLRSDIISGTLAPGALRKLLDRYTAYSPSRPGGLHLRYEAVDVLIQGLFELDASLAASEAEPGMVHLEFTPVSVILEMLDRLFLGPGDLFCDLGSGLGQVVMLVNLLTGVPALGIEYQRVYCEHAHRVAESLGLDAVRFLNGDVRHADLSEPTVFYMFAPFAGAMLDEVIGRLWNQARRRIIRICSYGDCTLSLAAERWLHPLGPGADHSHRLALFTSSGASLGESQSEGRRPRLRQNGSG